MFWRIEKQDKARGERVRPVSPIPSLLSYGSLHTRGMTVTGWDFSNIPASWSA